MMDENRIVSPKQQDDDEQNSMPVNLRPTSLSEFVG